MYKCKLREIHYASLQKLSGVPQAAWEWGACVRWGRAGRAGLSPPASAIRAPGPGERAQC